MTAGSLVAMFRYLTMLIWPLMGAGFMVNLIQRGAVSLGRINEVLNAVPSIADLPKINATEAAADFSDLTVPAIQIKGLNFSYNEDSKVLENITVSVGGTEWLGIMGKTGSGKSTLIKTFTRTVDPPPGTVQIFGLDCREWRLSDLRGVFAVSPQDSYLFSDSIQNNISYGFDDPDEALLQKNICSASLDRDIADFSDGIGTLIGEKGLTLSGGQKQRVAIARAMIMSSKILILDDSLSAVDAETERKILDALLAERKGKTTILISHRVSTLRYADKILVLDKGRQIECGSPADLAQSGGFYARMAALQRLDTGLCAPDGALRSEAFYG
jgi:ATP-binding cassette subfamily B protein